VSGEAVATARQSFDVAGFLGRIGQDIAQLLDGAVQTSIKVNKRVRRPEFLTEFLTRNQVTCMLQQNGEHLEGLVLKLQTDTVFVKLARTQVHIKRAEAGPLGSGIGFHGDSRPCRYSTTNCSELKRYVPGLSLVARNSPESRELHDQKQNRCRAASEHCAASRFAPMSGKSGESMAEQIAMESAM